MPEYYCGDNNDNCLHVLCECPYYSSSRDFKGMDVVILSRGYDVSDVFSVPENL